MSNLPNYDELVAVRLELSRIKDQREALEKTLQSDIMKIVRSAITQAADEVGCMAVELDDVKAENQKLKDRVEALMRAGEKLARYAAHGSPRRCWTEPRHQPALIQWAELVKKDPDKSDLELLYGMDPLVREAVESYKLTKHEDDVRRGLRPEKGGQS